MEHHQTMLHFAMGYLPLHVAQDIVQDSFIQIFERWDTYQSVHHTRYSLYMCVRNACISELRHETTKCNYGKNTLVSLDLNEEDSVEDTLIWHETYRLLVKAIDRLPIQGKRVIQLSLEGLSNQQIADTLGISINAVKLYKKNAYKKLRSELQSTEEGDAINKVMLGILFWTLFQQLV
ncbi:MAG: sigma-70 family RNA polymerase sigma factor [Bacteroidaceae bacterium]|nr:sigma-70 family RNA polymerase sigma factor [Bacteroidaceae bacterium]